MRITILITIIALVNLLLLGCDMMQASEKENPVYPMYVDDNNDGINDYTQESTHFPGDDSQAFLNLTKSSAVSNTSSDGHEFRDDNNDGICDYAQDGSSHWHGPGFIDENSNGICDYWEPGTMMHNHQRGVMYVDKNNNSINDYFEMDAHVGNAHNFIDTNSDGICDRAQDGSNSWHGPGFVDSDDNGVCDYWQPGNMGNGGMHHM